MDKTANLRSRRILGSRLSAGSESLTATPPTLMVPQSDAPSVTKVNRATSPLNFKAKLKKKKDKKLEKQANLSGIYDDLDSSSGLDMASSTNSSTSPGVDPRKPEAVRKKSKENPFSLYFRKNSRTEASSSTTTTTTTTTSGLGTPCSNHSLSPRSHSGDSFQYDGASLSPKPGSSPENPRWALTSLRSPSSPGGNLTAQASIGHCRCRRCSLLPFEECEPKEVSMLYRFLRKTKVENQSHFSFAFARKTMKAIKRF